MLMLSMTHPSAHSAPSIDQQAIAWQIRLTSGNVSDEEARQFADWLSQSLDHELAYRQVQRLWQQLPAPLATDRQRRRSASAPIRRHARLVLAGKFATAASLLLWSCLGLFPDYLQHPLADYRTRIGEQRSVVLADGSIVHLNTDTVIDVTMGEGERKIALLDGEAEFDVAHDANRPFRVVSDNVTTEALGTRFIVRHQGSEGTVTLLQGKVAIRKPSPLGAQADEVELHPGQRLQFDKLSLRQPQAVDTANIDAWRRGRLIANFVTLGDALAEINRYRRVPIRLLDAGLAERQINIAVDLSRVDDWLSALQQTMPISIVKAGPFVFLRS